jgi:hypothetical protein
MISMKKLGTFYMGRRGFPVTNHGLLSFFMSRDGVMLTKILNSLVFVWILSRAS